MGIIEIEGFRRTMVMAVVFSTWIFSCRKGNASGSWAQMEQGR